MTETKKIPYINKEFSDYKSALENYARTYFPNTFNDFSDSDPGMMFIEMASAIGDVLSFYQDTQIQEVFSLFAKEKENLYPLSYMSGYRPKVTSASSVKLDVYQLVPSILSGSNYVPDYSYTLLIQPGTQLNVSGNSNLGFYIQDRIDFSISSSLDPTYITVYAITGSIPTRFLLRKEAKAISGKIKTSSFSFGNPEKFPNIYLEDEKIIYISKITDSDGNLWYEVPYLAQETIYEDIQTYTDPNFSSYSNEVPYLLKLKKVPRRFVTRFNSSNKLGIEFGSGISLNSDEEIIPNPDNVGLGIVDGISKLNYAYDPSNFLYTNNYGIAPYNTTLTIEYLTGGGIESNAFANTINQISSISASFLNSNLDSTLQSQILNSIAINNPEAASGGGEGDTVEDLRLKSLSSFSSQLRAVNLEDYSIRTLSLPQKYGSIGKILVTSDIESNQNKSNLIPSINLHLLGFNNSKQLVQASPALKQNLKTYLSQYRLLTDSINIKDAFIINIGIQFEIIVLPNFNSQQVLLNCINTLKDYFNIDKWQINQPIIINEIYTLLDRVEGVQTVSNIDIINASCFCFR